MEKIIKFNKKFISFFLAVMIINTMVFTEHNAFAATTGLTISVSDSSNQSIPEYANGGGSRIDTIFNSNNSVRNTPVRLAANANAEISYNFANATMAKYQFVKASDLNTVPQFPQDSTMININLPAPNSYDAYASDIGDQGTISTMQYVYAGNPGSASTTAQLTRDASFGTPLSSTMLVQNATVSNDIPYYTVSGSNAFFSGTSTSYSNTILSKIEIYSSSSSQTKNSTYYVKNGSVYRAPIKNAAWKSMKFWGYFKPINSGYYNLGAWSDDGAYGYIIKNGQKQVFVDDWSIADAFPRTKNNAIWLDGGSYYPMYMEWYEGNPTRGAFTPVFKYDSSYSSNTTIGKSDTVTLSTNPNSTTSDKLISIPQNYFYSSKTTTPGTIPGAYFGDVSGIPFPTEDGIYYIATKFLSDNGATTTSGLYGPFIIDKTPPTISNLSVISNYSIDNKKAGVGNTLTITFKASETLQANPQILIDGYVADVTSYTKTSDNTYTATVKIAGDASINSSGDKITQAGQINVKIANYSDLAGNVGLPVQDSSVAFINATGISLMLTQDPTELTSGNVTITANASASGYGNSIKTMKYAKGNQPINYFTAGGTNLTISQLASNNDSNGILQSPAQSTFNVNTNGVYTVYAIDNSGNVAVQTIDVENIIVAPPVITSPTNGTSTSNNRPTISGTGQAGDTVTVYDETTVIGTAIVDSNGNWSMTVTTALINGNHAIKATQTDATGNTSGASNIVNLKIVPSAPVITSPITETSTSNNKPTITGTGEAGDTVTVYDGATVIGTATVDSNGNWSMTVTTALIDGEHVITATQADAAGNTSGASNTVKLTIDTSGPSRILHHGIYSGTGIGIAGGNSVVNGIPATMAMVVDAESTHPVINWSVGSDANDTGKIQVDNTSFKGYEILDGGTIGNSTQLTLDGSGNITGLIMQKGKEYLITYTITPTESGQVSVTAKADVTTPQTIDLTIGDKPDLF